MKARHATINTVTLTCSNCGSGQFTRLAPREYRCDHCHAVTLVEDSVAERLEQILRGMRPAPAAVPRSRVPAAVLAAGVAVVAAIAAWLAVDGLRPPSRPARTAAPAIDPSQIRLSDVQELTVDGRQRLVMLMRNETGQKINAPRVKAELFQDELTLSPAYGSPLASVLQPGEYTPVLVDLPSTPHTRYALSVTQPYPSTGPSRKIEAGKVQLVHDRSYRLVGLLKNADAQTASGLRVVVMLYDREGRIIGTGAGYGSAGSLAPGATTIFDVQCAMLADAPIAYYDYMVQSDS